MIVGSGEAVGGELEGLLGGGELKVQGVLSGNRAVSAI